MKSVRIRSFLWSIFSCNRTKNRKIRTRKNSVFGHFSCSDIGKNTSRHVDTSTTLAHSLSNCNGTQSHNNLIRKRTLNHLVKLTVNDWAVFLVLFYIKNLTVCSYHVTYAFQSESTLYGCLNVKELLTRNRCDIWRLSECNRTRTHNELVCKRTLNYLA